MMELVWCRSTDAIGLLEDGCKNRRLAPTRILPRNEHEVSVLDLGTGFRHFSTF